MAKNPRPFTKKVYIRITKKMITFCSSGVSNPRLFHINIKILNLQPSIRDLTFPKFG